MKLEDQVCTFEQAKIFEKLGVNAKSLFVWVKDRQTHQNTLSFGVEVLPADKFNGLKAYTVAELGILLGKFRVVRIKQHGEGDPYFRLESLDFTITNYIPIFGELTEAQARAECLIYLINQKLINPKTLTL